MTLQAFETKSASMARLLIIDVHAPQGDVDKILHHVCEIDPLAQGKQYDSNAYQSGPGIEHYRPLKGAVAGNETDVRKRPGIVKISFELSDDQELLEKVVEAIFQVHSYQEPVIRIHHILTCRSRGLDDKNNPHRWWNTTGDWKTAGEGDNKK